MKTAREDAPYRIQVEGKTFVFDHKADAIVNGCTLSITDKTRVTDHESTTPETFSTNRIRLLSVSKKVLKTNVCLGEKKRVSVNYTRTATGLKSIYIDFDPVPADVIAEPSNERIGVGSGGSL